MPQRPRQASAASNVDMPVHRVALGGCAMLANLKGRRPIETEGGDLAVEDDVIGIQPSESRSGPGRIRHDDDIVGRTAPGNGEARAIG